ncbi:hypothetical protein Pelo_13540 [Pelomyxa schiedti]|nr:hypothetical protein Pelo_13540 [Pelomyxa schiedti]
MGLAQSGSDAPPAKIDPPREKNKEVRVIFDGTACKRPGATSLVRVLLGASFDSDQKPTCVGKIVNTVPEGEDSSRYAPWSSFDRGQQWLLLCEIEQQMKVDGIPVTLRDTPLKTVCANCYGTPTVGDLGVCYARKVTIISNPSSNEIHRSAGQVASNELFHVLKETPTVFVIVYDATIPESGVAAAERAKMIAHVHTPASVKNIDQFMWEQERERKEEEEETPGPRADSGGIVHTVDNLPAPKQGVMGPVCAMIANKSDLVLDEVALEVAVHKQRELCEHLGVLHFVLNAKDNAAVQQALRQIVAHSLSHIL